MGIQVLGPLAVDGSGRLGPRDRSLLLALTVRQGRSVTSDELIDAVWGDLPPASARKNLQSCVVRLRRALGPDAIETTDQGYRLALPADDIDAARFESTVARARDLLAVGEADRVVFQLEKALALWRGRAFVDLAEWEPARREAGRLDELRMDAEELLLDADIRRGHAREALPRARAMVRSAPLRERRWELLALAQYRTGAQGEALRSIRQLRAVLAGELGIDPSPELVALEQSILRQDPTLHRSVDTPPPVATCPWQGLQAYDLAEADRFFGRDAEIEAGLAILADRRLLALVGPSGSGKSSLMRAGIGARLKRRGTASVTITPGRYPLHALTALDAAREGDAVLLDQAEELFTLCEDPDETRAFLDRLVEEAAVRPVAVALRADRMADLTTYAAFSRLVERGLYLVGGLDEAGMRLAVTGPAQQAGLLLEPGLVDLLVTEVRDDPGALPLLSHALLETWKRREGSTLTVDGYRASGGIHGAVAQSAEQLYAQVEPGHRDALRDLVLRLLSPGSEGEPVRTRVPRRLIGTDPDREHLIEMLVAARLVTSDDGVLEITHESLARAWPRLRGWLEDDIDGRRILHHLSSTADAWEGLGRPDSELYRGVRLTRALDWRTSNGATLTAVERDFLDASRARAEVEEQTAAERARAQSRLIRRLRIVLGGAAVLLVLALAAGGLAAVQSGRANDNALRAEAAALSADARLVGIRSQDVDDISLSLLLAVAGARLDDSPETRASLVEALGRNAALVRSTVPRGGYLESMAASNDGRWVASSDDQNRMHLYDAATDQWKRSYDADPAPTGQQAFLVGAFSPDSTQLAVTPEVGSSNEPVRLLEVDTMEATTDLRSPGDPVAGHDLQFSANGRSLAATVVIGEEATGGVTGAHAMVWDLRTPTRPRRIPITPRRQGVALSPDGRTVYTSWPLTAYDVATGEQVWRRVAVESAVVEANSEGSLLAAQGELPKDVLLLDPSDGTTVGRLRGNRHAVVDIRFSPDDKLVGTTSSDGELLIWDTATHRLRDQWRTQDEWGLGFSPDGSLVHGGGGASMLRAWDRTMGATFVRRTTSFGRGETFAHADLSPDGDLVAYRWIEGGQGWVSFVDTGNGAATTPSKLPTQELAWSFSAWRPDGGRYVGWCVLDSCSETGVATVLDPATGATIVKRSLFEQDVYAVAYVEKGSRLLVGSSAHEPHLFDAGSLRSEPLDLAFPADSITPLDDRTVMVFEDALDGGSQHWRVVDLASGELMSEGEVDVFQFASASSPDGSKVAVVGADGEIVTIDVASGAQRRSSGLGAAGLWLDWSADGTLLVSGADDGSVTLWDAGTLDPLGTVHPRHRGPAVPSSAQFVGDGHDVAIASYDGTVYRWDTDLQHALDHACQMAGRDMTKAEWAQYLPTQPYQSVCPQD